jgi:hypothetical protein
MSAPATVEERLAALEADVARLKQLLPRATPAQNWFEQVSGSMKDKPAFEEVIRLGREIRQADRPPDEA